MIFKNGLEQGHPNQTFGKDKPKIKFTLDALTMNDPNQTFGKDKPKIKFTLDALTMNDFLKKLVSYYLRQLPSCYKLLKVYYKLLKV